MQKVTAETLFTRVFLSLYPDGAQTDLARVRSEDANPAGNPHVTAHLADAAERFAALAPTHLDDDPQCDFTVASVHRLGRTLTRAWRDRVLAADPETLFNVVVHGAAYVGEVAVRHAGGTWQVRRPLWESLVHLESRAGEATLSPFSWFLRSLSDDEIEIALLGDRFRAYVEAPTADIEAFPVIAEPTRRLPKIAKSVRYDVLFKHMRAHLPELRDLGSDFPAPERFAEYKFRSLDFALREGGRLLVAFGPGEGGLHLFWLSARGFEKSMFVPCDALPAPEVRFGQAETKRGLVDTLTFEITREGKRIEHEMLVWGA
jgi:hypothetical protein